MSEEKCITCGELTGRSGILDDSLYLENGEGPLCENCYPEARILELEACREVLQLEIDEACDLIGSGGDNTLKGRIESVLGEKQAYRDRLDFDPADATGTVWGGTIDNPILSRQRIIDNPDISRQRNEAEAEVARLREEIKAALAEKEG